MAKNPNNKKKNGQDSSGQEIKKLKMEAAILSDGYFQLKRTMKSLEENRDELKERIKELGAIYGTSRILQKTDDRDEALQQIVSIIPAAYRYPGQACAKITYNGGEYKTKNFKKTKWCDSAEIIISGRKIGQIEACHLKKHAFLPEEREMYGEIASQIGSFFERKKAEIAAEAEKIKLNNILASMVDGVTLLDRSGIILYMNKAAEKQTGFTLKEAKGKTLVDLFIDKKDLPKFIESVQTIFQGKALPAQEYKAIRKNGEKFPASVNISPEFDKDGNIVALIAVHRDVTERHKAELSLAQSEKKYRSLTESMRDIVFQLDNKGFFKYISPAVQPYGFKPEDFISKNFATFIYSKDRGKILKIFLKTLRERKEFIAEFRVDTPKRGLVWFEENTKIQYDKNGKIIGLVGILRDISDRKEAQKTMAMLSKAVEQEVDGVAVTDLKNKIIFTNKAWKKMFKVKDDKRFNIADCLPAGERRTYSQLVGLLTAQKSLVQGFTCQNAEKSKFPCLVSLVLLEDERGKPFGTLHTFKDITDQKEYEERLKKEAVKLETLLWNIGDGVVAADKHGKVFMFNRKAQEITGYTEEQAMGKLCGSLCHVIDEETGKKETQIMEQALDGEIVNFKPSSVLLRADKSKIPVAGSAAPIITADGKTLGAVIAFRDVTQEREMDKRKTEFISIASHQLRTPLSAIRWYLEMLIGGDAGELNAEQCDYMNQILASNARMVTLVNDLLNVSRVETGALAIDAIPTDYNKLVESVIDELRPQMEKKKIKCVFEKSKSLKKIMLDPKLLHQVISNIIDNAVKYSPQKTTVTVKLRIKAPNIILSVADQGLGISKDDRSRIFTKFFRGTGAVKKQTEGSGLGLYLVKTVIDRIGGKIWFDSAAGKGTTFYIGLPLSGIEAKKGRVGLI